MYFGSSVWGCVSRPTFGAWFAELETIYTKILLGTKIQSDCIRHFFIICVKKEILFYTYIYSVFMEENLKI